MRLTSLPWLGTRTGKRATAAVLTGVSGAMVAGAVWLGVFPYYTDLRAGRQQERLEQAFGTAGTKESYARGLVGDGSPLTRIVIPRLGLDTIVVEGTSLKALAAGAGHYAETPLPGEAGNVAIAGHRTMNGKPFAHLEEMKPGDVIELITPLAKHTYQVAAPFDGHANPWVTQPNDWAVAAQSPERTLTLTTCHPRGSSKQRLVLRAFHVKTESL